MKSFLRKIVTVLFGIFSVYLLVIIQISLFNYFSIFSVTPNLLYILPFAFIFVLGEKYALLAAFFAGMIYDILSFGVVGVTPLFILVSLLLFSLLRRIFIHTSVTFFIYYYLSTLVYRAVRSGLHFSPLFFFEGFIDLTILLFFVVVLRFVVKIFSQSRVIQLRFSELR